MGVQRYAGRPTASTEFPPPSPPSRQARKRSLGQPLPRSGWAGGRGQLHEGVSDRDVARLEDAEDRARPVVERPSRALTDLVVEDAARGRPADDLEECATDPDPGTRLRRHRPVAQGDVAAGGGGGGPGAPTPRPPPPGWGGGRAALVGF